MANNEDQITAQPETQPSVALPMWSPCSAAFGLRHAGFLPDLRPARPGGMHLLVELNQLRALGLRRDKRGNEPADRREAHLQDGGLRKAQVGQHADLLEDRGTPPR